MNIPWFIRWAGMAQASLFILIQGCAQCPVQSPPASVSQHPDDSRPAAESTRLAVPWNLVSLPVAQPGEFKVDPYLRAARALQALGREEACKALLAETNYDGGNPGKAAVLCRMLFVKKAGGEFRGAKLGAPTVIGSTTETDWPLVPIELVDGIPFLIARGYRLAGRAESSQSYVRYCTDNCDWNSFPYREVTAPEKSAALNKLLKSTRWTRRLTDEEKTFLSDQIE